MKKNVISLVLALVMTVSLCVMPAIADNSNAKPYKVYTAIGDSIPAGYGPYNYLIKGYDRVPNTYPVYVADAVAEEYIPLARTGFRTVELRYMLEEDFEGDPPMLFSMGRMYEEEIALRKPTYEPSIVRSDLITLNVGTNDILSYAFYYAKDKLSNDPTYKKITDALNAMLGETDDIGLLFNEMFSMANSLGYYAEYFAAFAEGIYVGFNGLKENWDSIVGDIYALNPDVELLVIGIYNPLKTTSLTSYDIYPLGKAFQIIVDLANQYLKNTSKYCRQYTFVDVKDTEIYELGAFSDANYQKQMMGLTHPTKNGHQYMANQILKTLNLPANAGENDMVILNILTIQTIKHTFPDIRTEPSVPNSLQHVPKSLPCCMVFWITSIRLDLPLALRISLGTGLKFKLAVLQLRVSCRDTPMVHSAPIHPLPVLK